MFLQNKVFNGFALPESVKKFIEKEYLVHTSESWIDLYRELNALWIHDDNPRRPHALLTSGKHSNGFFNSELVMEDPNNLEVASISLCGKFRERGVELIAVDRVVGPAMGAITFAHSMAIALSLPRKLAGIDPCLRAYTEKATEGDTKRMVFGRTKIKKDEQVLLVEDVITTGGSVDLTAQAVIDAGGVLLPYVVTLVNRSGLSVINGKIIVALIDHPMPMWDPDGCPLCKNGSEAIRPKGAENWARLNASY